MSTREQRQDPRQPLQQVHVEVVDVESGVEFAADGKDLSAQGLAIHTVLEPAMGADMQVTVHGETPVRATLQVTRVEPTASGGYEVAGRLLRRR